VSDRRRVTTQLRPAAHAGDESLLVVFHLPKAGGTTLDWIIRRQYPDAVVGVGNAFNPVDATVERLRALDPSGIRAVISHLTMGVEPLLPQGARLLTVLRDPVDRALSHYSYLVDPPAAIRSKPGRAFGLLPAGREAPPAGTTVREGLGPGGWVPDNLQVRMLCGILSPFDELPADALERARANLRDRFAYVGVLDRLDELVALLTIELGWRTVPFSRERANPNRLRRGDLDADTLRFVEQRNELDQVLYDDASELFAAAFARAGDEGALELAVLRRLGELGTTEPDEGVRTDLPTVRARLAQREMELDAAYDRIDDLTRTVRKLQGRVTKLQWGLDHTVGSRLRARLRVPRRPR
jgi:hypothetical protein